MERDIITKITNDWVLMTLSTLDLKRIPSIEIRDLFKRSYEVLYYYHKDTVVPKGVSRMLLEMDGFLYFASMITDKEFDDNPYLYQAVHSIADALKLGFFQGEYECAYPVLKVHDDEYNSHILDLENGYIEDLI